MARERMVTRTITTATANCMIVEGREVKDVSIDLGSVAGLKADAVEQKAAEVAKAEGYLFVKVEDVIYTDTLYGMAEDDFLKYAKILPPRTKAEDETE